MFKLLKKTFTKIKEKFILLKFINKKIIKQASIPQLSYQQPLLCQKLQVLSLTQQEFACDQHHKQDRQKHHRHPLLFYLIRPIGKYFLPKKKFLLKMMLKIFFLIPKKNYQPSKQFSFLHLQSIDPMQDVP